MTPDRLLFLKKSHDIETIKKNGRRVQTSLFNLVLLSVPELSSGVCIVVGKRFGKAVARNRGKRLFREMSRRVASRVLPHRRFVVFPKRKVLEVRFRELQDFFVNTLVREGVVAADTQST